MIHSTKTLQVLVFFSIGAKIEPKELVNNIKDRYCYNRTNSTRNIISNFKFQNFVWSNFCSGNWTITNHKLIIKDCSIYSINKSNKNKNWKLIWICLLEIDQATFLKILLISSYKFCLNIKNLQNFKYRLFGKYIMKYLKICLDLSQGIPKKIHGQKTPKQAALLLDSENVAYKYVDLYLNIYINIQ